MDWYRRVVEKSAGGLWIIDLEGRTLEANAATAALLGVDPGGLVGSRVSDFLDEPGRAQLALHLDDLRAGRTNTDPVDCLFQRRDGTSVWAVVREALIDLGEEVEGQGSGTVVLLNVDDVSTRKRLYDDLQQSQRQRLEAERVARLGSWELDLASGSITYSEGLARVYGERVSTIFASVASFREAVHPDDLPRVTTAIARVYDGEEAFEFEARVHADRGWIWVYSRGVGVRGPDGELTGIIGTHLDVTQVRDTDDALRDLVKQNNLMQVIASRANEATTLLEVLREARMMVLLHDDWDRARAFTPDADGIGLSLLEPDEDEDAELNPAVAQRERTTARRALAERRAVWDDEVKLTCAFPVFLDDEVLAVLTITSLPPLYRHEMIETMTAEVAVQLSRVAERERLNLQMAEARDKALEASELKSAFLSTMSHEIRTPLNGVIGLAELLGHTVLDEEQHHLVAGINLSSRTLLSTISDVLDFSKIEAGHLQLEEVDFTVREVLDQVSGVLAQSAQDRDLELVVSCAPDVPDVASGDPTRLAQVVTNLASNAVKFTPSGRVAVHASAEADASGRPQLRVEVRDTGVGVPPDRLRAIFRAFSQADASTTRHFGGTGLGLAISQEIVEAMGGRIGVESTPGVGSTFWFVVPLRAPVGNAEAERVARTREVLRGMRVVVVEETDADHPGLSEQLACFDVAPARAEGATGLDKALARNPGHVDLFIVDLPGTLSDSVAVVDRIRAARGPDPVVAMSTTGEVETEVLDEHGIDLCLAVPVTTVALRDLMLEVRGELVLPPDLDDDPDEGPVSVTGRRVLVVEDNAVNRIVTVGLLARIGCEADTAVDGCEALVKAAETDYDLIFMDVQMPGIDGYETTRMLRAQEQELGRRRAPVVAITAAALQGERDRALESGMDDFATKPVNGTRIASLVAHWATGDAPQGPAPAAEAPVAVPVPGDVVLDPERLSELLEIPGGDTYVRNTLGTFLELLPTLHAAVRTAKNPRELALAAHDLKGSSSNIGAALVARVAAGIELSGRLEQPVEEDRFAELADAVAQTRRAVTTQRDRMGATAPGGQPVSAR